MMPVEGIQPRSVASDLLPPLRPPHPIPLTTLPSHECSYLPGRVATSRAFRIDKLPGEVYHQFMDAGFRRSGKIIYQQVCENCRECVPIRIPVDRFKPSKSHRRCARLNSDLLISHAAPVLTDEKLDLYQRYIADWHGGANATRESLENFLYESPVDTLEFCYRTVEGKLVAVGIADVCQLSCSGVYFYFDPDQSHRSLGTYGVLTELKWSKMAGIPHYYLGFWISGCVKMQYKSCFKPSEFLRGDGLWLENVAL